MWNDIADKRLYNIIPEDRVLRDEPMYKHTTFRVGGPALRYVSVNSADEVTSVMNSLKGIGADILVLGHGSNVLVSDSGYDGLVLELGQQFSDVEIDGTTIKARAGIMLGQLAILARDSSLTGLEFAAGIPGTLGGAICMNAGAYGSEMKDVVVSATLYDADSGRTLELTNEELDLSYRHSIVKDKGYIVLSVRIKLEQADRASIDERMNDLATRRRGKQPLEYPSAGSTFKRPEGFYAGALIQESGLKGYSVGDAQVSLKHAGFIINKGHATAADIYHLIREVREKVYSDSGVMLEPEVVFVGDFS